MELTGLTGGTAYKVQMRSHNAVGVSAWLTIGFTSHTPSWGCPTAVPERG